MPALLLGTKTIFHFPRPVSAPCSACKSLYALWASPGTKPSAKGPQLSLAPRHQPSATFIFDTMGTDLYTFHLTHLGGWKGRTGFVYAAGQVPALYPWLQPHPKHRSSCLNGNPSFLFSGSSFSKSSLFHARSVAVEGPKNIKAGFTVSDYHVCLNFLKTVKATQTSTQNIIRMMFRKLVSGCHW